MVKFQDYWENSYLYGTREPPVMAVETDDHGRLYLPKNLREKHGERFRVLDLPRRVVLIPIADDPLQAVRDTIGDRFEGRSLDDIEDSIETAATAEIDAEVEERRRTSEDE